ncbi:MAG: ParB/Srx family N-terminal domain-containing protein, partial [Candidatus Aenigmatarchaeota archaeon]
MQEMVKFLDPYRKRKMAFVLLSMNEVELPQVQRDVSNQLKTQLELAIDKLGFIVPIVVVPNDDGKYLVIDGQHRFLAMQSLGAKEVTA